MRLPFLVKAGGEAECYQHMSEMYGRSIPIDLAVYRIMCQNTAEMLHFDGESKSYWIMPMRTRRRLPLPFVVITSSYGVDWLCTLR